MKVFCTGLSGFVGQRLLMRLVREGHEVSGLCRSERSTARVERAGGRPVTGALEDITPWRSALEGHDVVIHLAAPVEVWGPWARFEQIITHATMALYSACQDAGVRRFIYLSSESVLQGQGPLLDIDETHPYPKEPNSYYGKAKMLAEMELLRSISTTECVILRPTYIWGKGDYQRQNFVDKIKARQFMWIDRGSTIMEMVHVDNIVEAIRLAMTQGRSGEIYTVTDDRPMSTRDFLGPYIETTGTSAPDMSAPSWAMRPLASAVEFGWRLARVRTVPPISRFQLDFLALPRRYRIDKIKTQMRYEPVTSLEQGLAALA